MLFRSSSGRQVPERVSLHGLCELAAQLGGHEDQSHPRVFKIPVDGFDIKTHLFRNNMDHGACCQCGVEVHQTGIKTKACIGCHAVGILQLVIASVPGAKVGHVLVVDADPFGLSCGPAGVEDDKEIFFARAFRQLAGGQAGYFISEEKFTFKARN